MITILTKILVTLLIVAAAWFLAMKALPRIARAVGRLLGFRMKASPLTERRLRRFRSIRRGHWSFVFITTAFVASLFLELYVNNKALYVRWGDHVETPAVAQWLNGFVPFLSLDDVARNREFGLEGDAELDYRQFARWADDPETLEADAKEIEEEIRADEEEYRERMEKIAKQKGAAWDPESPLPEYKVEEYDRMRGRAAALRALQPQFEEGKAGILLTLHPYSPDEQLLGLPGPPPHRAFAPGVPILGTDFDGKEVLSQILYGFRISFAFAVVVAFIGFSFGIAAGGIMGFYGGWTDILVQRFIEVWSSIPFLFTMMILASLITPGFFVLALMLIVLRAWLGITYTVRGEFYREKSRDYVQAARAIGVKNPVIMAKHILPNSLVPVVTFLPFAIVAFIGALVSLDFLGFGLPPGVPSWGALLRQGSDNIVNYPELVWFPVAALAITLFCVVMVGEAVREAFDPKKYSRLR